MGSQKFSSLSEQHLERLPLEFRSQEIERDTTMKTTTKNTSIKVNTGVKAGGTWVGNHVRAGLKVKSSVAAGGKWALNHSCPILAV